MSNISEVISTGLKLMKHTLLFILGFGFYESHSQSTVPIPGSTKTNTVRVLNGFKVDSFQYIPVNDKDTGNLRISGGILQYKNGSGWQDAGGGSGGGISKAGNGIRIVNGDSAVLGLDISDPDLAGNIGDQTYIMNYDPGAGSLRGFMFGFPDISPTLNPLVIRSFGTSKGSGEMVLGSGFNDTSGIVTIKGQTSTNRGGYVNISAGGIGLQYQGPGHSILSITPSEFYTTTYDPGSTNFQSLTQSSKGTTQSIEYTYSGGVSNGIVYGTPITYTDSSLVDKRYVDSKSSVDQSILVTGTTTDATPTTIATIPIPNGAIWAIYFRTIAKNSATEAASFSHTLLAGNNGGGVADILDGGISEIFTPIQTDALLTAQVSAVASGGNILLQVTGIAAMVNWRQYITIIKMQ